MSAIISRINLYFKNIYLDYYEVFKEVNRNARNRPLRAGLYGASSLFALNLFRVNESLRSYTGEVTSACVRMGALSESSRNPVSEKFVQTVGELSCHKLLRQIDLGFSTLIYKVDTNPEVKLFRHNCPYLRPSIKEFFQERIVDLGIMGHWLLLETKMKDYDINESEYSEIEFENKQ